MVIRLKNLTRLMLWEVRLSKVIRLIEDLIRISRLEVSILNLELLKKVSRLLRRTLMSMSKMEWRLRRFRRLLQSL